MTRSKDAWLNGPGDLREDTVMDVPIPGESVQVRALSAKYSAEVQGQLRLTQQGTEAVAKIDVAAMELLQFRHGVIDPVFTLEEATQIQERFGPAFRKVIAKIDEISGIDKEAIEQTEQRFRDSGTGPDGPAGVPGTPAGSSGPAVPLRASA